MGTKDLRTTGEATRDEDGRTRTRARPLATQAKPYANHHEFVEMIFVNSRSVCGTGVGATFGRPALHLVLGDGGLRGTRVTPLDGS